MGTRRRAPTATSGAGDLGFERQLFRAADKLRSNMDAAEYKHVVLGLVFLKYVSDAFAEVHARRVAAGRDAEDRAAYAAEGVFWVPRAARWAGLASAGPDGLGRRIDAAIRAIERDNPALAGVLVRDEGWLARTGQRLGELVELIGTIGLGSAQRSKDILGRVYEYFLSEFAVGEGRKGGQFYTPRSVVRLLVELLTPYDGRVYDPCCGSGGMFVQSERSVAEHGGRALKSMHIYGQESNPTTWRLARMNLALRGISADLGAGPADTLQNDVHPELAAEYVLANPPFNARDWGAERLVGDPRWRFGVPPANNANFAWVQHIIHHMGRAGQAGFVLANGSMSSNISGEGAIRGRIVEADLVDAMVALPGQLFYSTQIPACVWLLARDRGNRRGRVLFIDARQLGRRLDRSQCELTDEVIARVAGVYHAWRGGESPSVPGFCAGASVAEIRANGYQLTPGRYVGSEARAGEGPKDRLAELAVRLDEHAAAAAALDAKIRRTLAGVLRG
jgi:type I restriction enzyme M protein